jgi:hypothetical protein
MLKEKGIVMFKLKKLVGWTLFMTQCSVILWLCQRTNLDMFSQLILLPLLLISGLALLSLKTDN